MPTRIHQMTPKRRRRLVRKRVYEGLGRLAQDGDWARLGAILGILEGQLDDFDAIDGAVRLLEWAGSDGGQDQGPKVQF